MLSTSVDDNPFQWEELLGKVCFAYNTSVQSTTGFTPFFVMYGRETRLPIDCVFELPQQSVQVTEYAYSLMKSLNQAYELARKKFGMKQQREKESYNKHQHGIPYAVRDIVRLHSTRVCSLHSRKFKKPRTNPYKMLQRINVQVYKIKHIHTSKKLVVHFDR